MLLSLIHTDKNSVFSASCVRGCCILATRCPPKAMCENVGLRKVKLESGGTSVKWGAV